MMMVMIEFNIGKLVCRVGTEWNNHLLASKPLNGQQFLLLFGVYCSFGIG